MDNLTDFLWGVASKAGPLAALLCLVWGVSQFRRAEKEREERIAMQLLIHGRDGNDGLLVRVTNALNNAAAAVNSMNDMVRPLIAVVLEKAIVEKADRADRVAEKAKHP